jgi:hypothetical protein
LCALCLIALAITVRLVLIANWPLSNSDEGTMGLMALHIAYQGKIPVFFYGQGYMGSLEALLAAPLFRLFGPSYFTLRLGLVWLYALFLLTIYILTSILYTKRLALFTLLLLSFGTSVMFFLQLLAAGGYPDMFFFGSFLLLYALILARSVGEMPPGKVRVLTYAGWGVLVGLALWDDLLLLAYVIMSGVMLWRFCRDELRRPVILSILTGFILALTPLVIYNLTTPLTYSTFKVIYSAFWVRGTAVQVASPLLSLAGTLFVALPRATGGNVFCSSTWPPYSAQTTPAILCTAMSGLWGIGYLALMLISGGLAYAAYRASRRAARLSSWTPEQRREAAGYFAQLMLVGSVLLVHIAFAASSPSGLDPRQSTRYLSSVPIALPAVLWPIWHAGSSIKRALLANSVKVLKAILLCALLFSFVAGWVQTLGNIPSAQAAEQQEADLIHALLNRGITHIYTDYWTCDRIAFESREQIICSVVDEQLHPGNNRYTPYTSMIKADPRASWVFQVGSPQALAFAQHLQQSGQADPSFTRDGYVIYLPAS